MSAKISQIKTLKLNGDVVVAPKNWSLDEIKGWYVKGGNEISSTELISLTDKIPYGESDYATAIEQTDFEAADLPFVL